MKQPPTITPADRPGPGYDPMDQIVENLQNVESFTINLSMQPRNLTYLNSHLTPILGLRRTIAHQLEKLIDEPYNYLPAKIKKLQQENEQMFLYLEGAVGSMNPWNEKEFNKFIEAFGASLSKLDDDLTP